MGRKFVSVVVAVFALLAAPSAAGASTPPPSGHLSCAGGLTGLTIKDTRLRLRAFVGYEGIIDSSCDTSGVTGGTAPPDSLGIRFVGRAAAVPLGSTCGQALSAALAGTTRMRLLFVAGRTYRSIAAIASATVDDTSVPGSVIVTVVTSPLVGHAFAGNVITIRFTAEVAPEPLSPRWLFCQWPGTGHGGDGTISL
jgi:hypothetical protein